MVRTWWESILLVDYEKGVDYSLDSAGVRSDFCFRRWVFNQLFVECLVTQAESCAQFSLYSNCCDSLNFAAFTRQPPFRPFQHVCVNLHHWSRSRSVVGIKRSRLESGRGDEVRDFYRFQLSIRVKTVVENPENSGKFSLQNHRCNLPTLSNKLERCHLQMRNSLKASWGWDGGGSIKKSEKLSLH